MANAAKAFTDLLDEQGIKYRDMGVHGVWFAFEGLVDDDLSLGSHTAEARDQGDGLCEATTFNLTPEQVLEVLKVRDVVKRSECVTKKKCTRDVPICPCGQAIGDDRWGYCPKCGRRIVD